MIKNHLIYQSKWKINKTKDLMRFGYLRFYSVSKAKEMRINLQEREKRFQHKITKIKKNSKVVDDRRDFSGGQSS